MQRGRAVRGESKLGLEYTKCALQAYISGYFIYSNPMTGMCAPCRKSGEQEIAGVQAARGNLLQRDRVVRAEADHGIGADLMHRRLHCREVREHAAVELDVIAMSEVGDDIVAEAGAERECVIARPARQHVVARSDVEHIVAAAAVE